MTASADVPRTLLSSFCRYEEHARCTAAKAKCECKCHASKRPRAVVAVPEREAPRPNPIERSPMASPESKRRERVEPTVELVKEAPPPSRREHGLLVRCADQFDALRADPGEWYRLLDYGVQKSALSGAGYLRKKTTGFEFTARGGCVYARYVDEAAS